MIESFLWHPSVVQNIFLDQTLDSKKKFRPAKKFIKFSSDVVVFCGVVPGMN
jgi:hypothetical protein